MRALLLVLIALALPAAELERRIERLLAGIPAGARAAVAVADCASRQALAAVRADASMVPASTLKLPVSAAALDRLGEGYRFRTRVVALGPLADGAAPGIGIIGGGSPCLDEHFTARQPDRIFADWAARLREAGVRRIAGDVVIDGRMFAGPIRPATYPGGLRNAISWFSAPASAFAWNDNCIEVRAVPTTPGEPARIEIRPRSARIQVVNRTVTVASGGADGLSVTRALRSNAITVSGRYAKTTDWNPLAIHQDPELLAGDHLVAVFAAAGIAVAGEVRLGEVAAEGRPLLIDHRDELLPALRIMNQRSQNFYAEQVLRVVAAESGRPGSTDEGAAVVTAWLERTLGRDHGFIVLDGSGLSHGNRATAQGLVALLVHQHHAQGERYAQTLRPREVGRARALVKTGSLAIATTLAGYIDPPGGGRRAFAILLNAADGGGIEWAPAVRDRVLAELAAP